MGRGAPHEPRQAILIDIAAARRPETKLNTKIEQEVAAARAFMLEVVGQALGEYPNEIVSEIGGVLAPLKELVDELRKARGIDDDGDEPIDLPNPISRRLQ